MAATLVAENSFAQAGSASGVVFDFGSAPSAGQWDTILIVSNGVIQVQSDFATEVLLNNAASTLAWREATGDPGEQFVTITTPQGAVNLVVHHQRWDGAVAFEVVDSAMLETAGNTTPSLTTGTLAETGELAIVAVGMIGFSSAPTTPSFSSPYVDAHPGNEITFGSGSDAVAGWVGYNNNAGTAAETPSITWVNGSSNRYGFVIAFTAGTEPSEVTLTPAVLTFEGVAVTPQALPVTVTLTPAVLTFQAVALTPAAVPVVVTLTPAVLTLEAIAVDPDPLPVTVTLTPASLSFVAVPLSPSPGGGSEVTLEPAILVFEAPELNPTPANDGQDLLLYPEAVLLLNCLRDALEAQPNPPGVICLRAGDHVVQDVGIPGYSRDECCEGQAYVRIVGFYMTGGDSTPFPSPSTDAPISPCGIPAWGLQMEMGVFRCIRTDRSPTCTEWTLATQRQMSDAKAMRAALCCFEALHDPQTVAVGTWGPAGPDGGCIGSTWPVSVEVLNCGEC